MSEPTLKSALLYCEQIPSLTEADRAHLKRWHSQVKDPVWVQIAADAMAYGELPPIVEGPYSYFINSALRARRSAASMKDSPSVQRKRKDQLEQKWRADLLVFAEKLEEVARQFKSFSRRLPPDPSGKPTVPRLERERSLEWLKREAQEMRQRAEQKPRDDYRGDYVQVNVSRQSRGPKKGTRSRELGVFMQIMVNSLHRACGKPRHHAVAAMTNIAFPDANVDLDDVRSACRPTTRAGRRGGTGALSQ